MRLHRTESRTEARDSQASSPNDRMRRDYGIELTSDRIGAQFASSIYECVHIVVQAESIDGTFTFTFVDD